MPLPLLYFDYHLCWKDPLRPPPNLSSSGPRPPITHLSALDLKLFAQRVLSAVPTIEYIFTTSYDWRRTFWHVEGSGSERRLEELSGEEGVRIMHAMQRV